MSHASEPWGTTDSDFPKDHSDQAGIEGSDAVLQVSWIQVVEGLVN